MWRKIDYLERSSSSSKKKISFLFTSLGINEQIPLSLEIFTLDLSM
jgi:hypothetical protein